MASEIDSVCPASALCCHRGSDEPKPLRFRSWTPFALLWEIAQPVETRESLDQIPCGLGAVSTPLSARVRSLPTRSETPRQQEPAVIA